MGGEQCVKQTPVTLFKDPVHGYISVPKDYCKRFIDTPIFQRLRHIEQTSMRPLFPGARHDRFIHSLGVFFLGTRMYDALIRNTDDDSLQAILVDPYLRATFQVACLMHDCGHAPFSHTFEKFYNYKDTVAPKHAFARLHEVLVHEDFKVPEGGAGFEPAPHEAVSAIVLFQHYRKDADKTGWDCSLACRMITGCTIPSPSTDKERVHNALIGLLNGDAIDCDKLDYIVRDTWASGVKNTAIDADRLLDSYCLVRDGDKVRACHLKSALSVIQMVVDARNYLFEWVYSHHTVLYHAELMRRSLEKLAVYLSRNGPAHQFWETVFSDRAFQMPQKIDDLFVYMPTDADLVHFLKAKKDVAQISDYDEVLSRTPSRFALWKTYAEFHKLFEGTALGSEAKVRKNIHLTITKRIPAEFAKALGCKSEEIVVVDTESKHYSIGEGDIWIRYPNDIGTYTDIYKEYPNNSAQRFFFVFVPNRFDTRKEELIRIIQRLER